MREEEASRGAWRSGLFRIDHLLLCVQRVRVGWCVEWIDTELNASGGGWWGECFGDGRPHAPSASGTDGDVGVSMVVGESEEWTNGAMIDVKNVLDAG